GPAPQIVYTLVHCPPRYWIIACPCALGLATPMSIIGPAPQIVYTLVHCPPRYWIIACPCALGLATPM
ncbi:hypothetical protein CKQ79_30070, partial [Klebsiella pneumoniae]